MIAIVKSEELVNILNEDETMAAVFAWNAKTSAAYISIRNVVDVLDQYGVELKLTRQGANLVIHTAGITA